MPRNHNLGTSTLRNRNRVTNKTRLKVIQGNIDADPLVLDEDEEKARIVNTAGVDAEDANEHHLQAVLSAASQRHQSVGRTTRGVADKPPAYIPTPDSTGIIDNYEEFYPPHRWKQPEPYVRFSETVEESCASAIIDGFTYFMDERDKEWLDRNNGEARGEGTSAQGALPISGTTTRSGMSQRSAKAKGKEPDCNQPVTITEDEFELVMGIFEKITHDKTPFLHTGLDSGMSFPPFSDYQDVFSLPLLPSMFAAFAVPPWIPPPSHLLRIAKVIYPHWRERRMERGGHRIIPTLNFDETDATNESYICFRRREIKSARKTRASQATSSDKLLRLQLELAQASELANSLLARENLQKENAQQTMQVWEKRLEFADLKRKFPSLSTKEDEELLHDKERVVKKPKIESAGRSTGLKIRARDGDAALSVVAVEAIIRPKKRLAQINADMERDLARRKERDHGYEDVVESAYQRPSLPYSRRHWKSVSSSSRATPSRSRDDDVGEDAKPEHIRYLRYRLTRLGGVMLDRRDAFMQRMGISDDDGALLRRRRAFGRPLDSLFDDVQDEEMKCRLRERWRFDQDDDPAVAPEGPEEQDRVLIDDYEPKYLRHMMTLLTEQDHQHVNNDATLYVLQEGRTHPVTPYRIGAPQPTGRKEQQNGQRVYANGTSPLATSRQMSASVPLPSIPNGIPISMQAHMKGVQPLSGVPHARISNGGIRPPGTPNANQVPIVPSVQPSAQQAGSSASPTNGSSASPTTVPVADGDVARLSPLNGTPGTNGSSSHGSTHDVREASIPPTPEVPASNQPSGTPRQKAEPQQAVSIPLNGYHVPMNGYAISNMPYMQHARQLNGLSPQQMKDLRSVFAQDPSSGMQGTPGRQIQAPYVGHLVPSGTHFNVQMGTAANVNLKVPPGRQWNGVASPLQQTPSLANVLDGGGTPMLSSPHNTPGIIPPRTPSANGNRAVGRPGNMGAVQGAVMHGGQYPAHSSPRLPPNSPSPSTAALPLHQSPPRPPPTPTLKMASPSIQQSVPSSQGGY
ncbi:enhancer of polycomb-like-domain-containing protein [Pisolithus microcarpus]|nr:enhancer of polycomb-like-domain-containing protein [Pisolithus microcarpus]